GVVPDRSARRKDNGVGGTNAGNVGVAQGEAADNLLLIGVGDVDAVEPVRTAAVENLVERHSQFAGNEQRVLDVEAAKLSGQPMEVGRARVADVVADETEPDRRGAAAARLRGRHPTVPL